MAARANLPKEQEALLALAYPRSTDTHGRGARGGGGGAMRAQVWEGGKTAGKEKYRERRTESQEKKDG